MLHINTIIHMKGRTAPIIIFFFLKEQYGQYVAQSMVIESSELKWPKIT